jgi:predicted NUDIX family NTP pyrophosphohydrolase
VPKVSAGLLMVDPEGRFLLAHPGGPYFARRDAGVWSIPKGLVEPGEELLSAAKREFAEELGFSPETRDLFALGSIKQSGGKVVHAWAFRGVWDPALLNSNHMEIEWPPHSGKRASFPEVDQAGFFELAEAERKIVLAQCPLLRRAASWFGKLPADAPL